MIRLPLSATIVIAIMTAACSTTSTLPQPEMNGNRFMDHIAVLSADSLLGRAPGSLGEDRTIAYLEAAFRGMGLQPGNPDGSYIQKVPLVGITADPAMKLVITGKGGPLTGSYRENFVAWTRHVADSASIRGSELVFVGYGVQAPEFDWDDFKGVDVKGKTLVVLINDPPLADSTIFGGKAMTYYGRWTYKFDKAAELGASGMLIIHQTEPAGYPWPVVQGMGGEKFDLVTTDRNLSKAAVEGWISESWAREIFARSGKDFDSLVASAATRDFTPVPLGALASVTIKNTLRTLDSRNVAAKVTGSDPTLADQYVIYTAHWDHFGVGQPVDGDSIYNGALDNATGTAGLLELAQAFQSLNPKPKRSVLFLAVTAEEQGLLGSAYYSVAPLYPLNQTVANINIDGLNMLGKTSDIVVIGLGNSELDQYLRSAATLQNRTLVADPEPEKGFYYRSDHFNFAKQGVPALYTDAGTQYEGKPIEFGIESREDYTANRYHKPSDQIMPEWVPDGAIQDLTLFFQVGYQAAQAERWPEWAPNNEFRAKREASLKNQR